ncbi:MAG TPA: hypothetical protein VG293_08255 [Solirubrobacteraceae bacterium]|nr:hypothetical protein [Solirubrobacteraceae bacterium]
MLTAAGGVLRLGGDTFGWALAWQVLIAVAQPVILNAVTGLASGYLSARSRPVWIATGAAVIGFLMLAALPVILEISERRAGSAGTSATALIWLSGNACGIVIAILVQIVVHHPTVAFLLMASISVFVLRFVSQGWLSAGTPATLPDGAPG